MITVINESSVLATQTGLTRRLCKLNESVGLLECSSLTAGVLSAPALTAGVLLEQTWPHSDKNFNIFGGIVF